MANEHRQGCSMLLIVREMQVKTTSTQVRMAIIKHLQTTNAGEGVEKREFSCIVGGSVNWLSHYGEQYGDAFWKKKKKGIILLYDPTIPLLGIYPEKTIIQKDACTLKLTAALLTIARTWKQPRCPSADEWIRKQWYIYTKEYYSGIQRNESESVLVGWMNQEACHTQWSKSEREKQMLFINAYIWYLENGPDKPTRRAGIETQTQQGKEKVGRIERAALTRVHFRMWNRRLVGSCVWHRELGPVLCDNLEGWVVGWGEVQEAGDVYIYLWLIHVAWQKPTHCKAIILQLKIN